MFINVADLTAYDMIIPDKEKVIDFVDHMNFDKEDIIDIIPEGVIKESFTEVGINHYIYFKDIALDQIYIEDYLHYVDKNYLCFCFSAIMDFTQKGTTIEKSITNIVKGPTFDELEKKHRPNMIFYVAEEYLYVFKYLYLIQKNRRVEYRIDNAYKSKKTSTHKMSRKHRRSIIINDLKIITKKDPLLLLEKLKRNILRKAESWTVRGHFRHLKNGKIIPIKPYVKGKGKFNPKDYNIK